MRFRANTADILQALSIAGIVTPRPVTPQGAAGYLFVLGVDSCQVYSSDGYCVSKASFPVSEVEGEGSFVYPAQYTEALKLVGDSILIEALSDGEAFTVRYEATSGASSEKASFSPDLLSTCDEDLTSASAGYDFPAGLLAEAISMSRPFLAKSNDARTEEQFKGLVIFDKDIPSAAKGDGSLYAANGLQHFYFYSEALLGKSLEIHGQHLPLLCSFLAKSQGNVQLTRGEAFTFLSNAKGHVLGWPKHMKTHTRYKYFSLSADKFVLAMPKAALLNALKLIRMELDPKKDAIKFHYHHETRAIQFTLSESTAKAKSFPIPVEVKATEERNVTAAANIDHLLALVEGVRGNEVELRLAVQSAPDSTKEIVIFRTLDTFRLTPEGKVVIEPEGSFACTVTRMVPSRA